MDTVDYLAEVIYNADDLWKNGASGSGEEWEEYIAKVVCDVLLRDVVADALEEAAKELDFIWEVFTAEDGIRSIRQHGKTPAQLLVERAARLRNG